MWYKRLNKMSVVNLDRCTEIFIDEDRPKEQKPIAVLGALSGNDGLVLIDEFDSLSEAHGCFLEIMLKTGLGAEAENEFNGVLPEEVRPCR